MKINYTPVAPQKRTLNLELSDWADGVLLIDSISNRPILRVGLDGHIELYHANMASLGLALKP